MLLNEVKGLTCGLLVFDTLLFGWLPYVMVSKLVARPANWKLRDIVISHINSFAGGVFLGVCLLGLMVEGRETMNEYFEKTNTHTDLPIYEALIAVGFFLIALVEKSAHLLMHGPHFHKKKKRNSPETVYMPEVNGNTSITSIRYKPESGSGDVHENGVEEIAATQVSKCAEISCEHNDMQYSSCGTQTEVVKKEDPLEHMDDAVRQVAQADLLGAFLLLSAFSFHTVFDGLAIGLQDSYEDVWKMFIGIVTHKSLVSLCLGLQFFIVFRNRPAWAFFWIFFLSLVSPLGVGIGIAIFEGGLNQEGQALASGVLQGVATGTFLYVTCFEILHSEIVVRPGLLRLFLAVVGFAAMLVMNAIPYGGEHH